MCGSIAKNHLFFYVGPISMDKVHYCERFIELMLDLEVSYCKFFNLFPGVLMFQVLNA